MAEQLSISMDDILSDKKPVQVETKITETPAGIPVVETKDPVERAQSRKNAHRDKEQLAQGRVRDPETGQYSLKVEPEAKAEPVKTEPAAVPAKPAVAAPTQELNDKEKAFLKGMQEERTKRQELERRLAAIEAAKPAEPVKTFWDDPEAALAKQRQDITAATTKTRLDTAEAIARIRHTDYDEKYQVLVELLNSTPGLYQQVVAAPDPAEYGYGIAKSHMEIKDAGGVDELRAKIEKEVRLKIETELKEKAEALKKEQEALPSSLSDARSKGTNKPVWNGPPSFDSILKG